MPPRSRTLTTGTPATTASPGDNAGQGASPGTDQRPVGFAVGNAAKTDKFAPMLPDGTADLSKITEKAPKGMGVQIVAKGDEVSQAVYDQLNPPKDET